jgi:hypothetical protein
MKTFIKLMFFMLIVFSLICCSKDSPTDPDPGLSGEFVLTHVDGQELPFLAEETDDWQEYLAAGYLELIQSGRFEWEITWMRVELTETSFQDDAGDGNFMVNGNTITFVPNSGDQFTGTLSNNILTIIGGLEDELTFTFVKD